jgi:hypothetical protein
VQRKHGDQWLTTLKGYAYPIIGDKRVVEITTDDVLNVLRPNWQRVRETASRVRQRIEAVLERKPSGPNHFRCPAAGEM